MQLNLNPNTRIKKISFNEKTPLDSSQIKKFGLKVEHVFLTEPGNRFAVIFDIEIYNPSFELIVTAEYWFTTDSTIDEAFKVSDLVSINAPAIAFPFLRAFVGNLTLQSGYPPVLLPSINFIEMNKDNRAVTDEKIVENSI